MTEVVTGKDHSTHKPTGSKERAVGGDGAGDALGSGTGDSTARRSKLGIPQHLRDRSRTPKPVTKRRQRPTPSRHTPVSPAPASTPKTPPLDWKAACLISERYWQLLGKPGHQARHLAATWPNLFDPLLATYTYDDLLGAMEWAWTESDFWPPVLQRRNGDPVEYFVGKIEKILPQFLAERTAAENAAKKQANASNINPKNDEDMRLVLSLFKEE